jgi:hypothetical protein
MDPDQEVHNIRIPNTVETICACTEGTVLIQFNSSGSPLSLNFHVQFKNQFRGLDDDEVDFLDRVDDMRTEAEKVLF